MVETTELGAQQVLRIATARARGDAINALRNESTQFEYLRCSEEVRADLRALRM